MSASVTLLVIISLVRSAPPLGFLPNIIIFYADDYGWGDTQTYGHPVSLTPNIDQLAYEGTKLTDFYSASPVCSPSRAALLTGRYQTRSGVWPGVFWEDSVGGLPASEITIAKFLKMNGLNYSTAIIGKWHLGTGGENGTYLPTNRGFDFYTGIPYSHDMPNPPYCFPDKRGCWPYTAIDPWNDTCLDSYTSDIRWDYDPIAMAQEVQYKKQYMLDKQAFEVLNPGKRMQIPIELRRSENVHYEATNKKTPALPLYYNTEIIQQPVNMTMIPSFYTKSALSFLKQSVDQNQKFFLYMAFHQTHHPQFASSMFFNTSQRGMFGDAQAEMDYNLGQIMKYIKQLGVNKETFVFFASDNGPSLMRETRGGNAGPLKCGKGTTYEGGQRVPGIAWMPDYIEQGRVSGQIGSTLDLLPTIADLVDIQLPTDRYYDGVSMMDWIFKGGDRKSKRNIFHYFAKSADPTFGWQQSLQAVRLNQWKMHWIISGSHCPNYYKDPDCRSSKARTNLSVPLLFNLHHDISEAYAVNISLPYYANLVKEINRSWHDIFATEGLWAESEINKGKNASFAPCCNWGCTHWPQCCACDKMNNEEIAYNEESADYLYDKEDKLQTISISMFGKEISFWMCIFLAIMSLFTACYFFGVLNKWMGKNIYKKSL